MIYLKTPEEIEKMRQASTLVSRTLGEVAKWVAPGVTTRHLDNIAREFMRDNGGKPACLGYGGFPGTLCIEVNETVVHGFPSGYELRDGDIIGIDTVVELDGYHGDMCYTFPVGEIAPKCSHSAKSPRNLYQGISAAQGRKTHRRHRQYNPDLLRASRLQCSARNVRTRHRTQNA